MITGNVMPAGLAVGVDVGGTKIAFALIDQHGAVRAESRVPTQAAEGVEAVIARIADGVRAMCDQAGGHVTGIGVGCPGHVQAGVVRNAVNLGWEEVALAAALAAQISLPVQVRNDAVAAAIGEMWCGAARGCRDFVHVAIGTGLGGCAVSNGQVIGGVNGFAMEIGHLPAMPGGRLCTCGGHGCTEMYASGVGLLAGVREGRAAYPESVLARMETPSTADILAAMRAGDPLALATLESALSALCHALTWCIGVLNPALIVIGGGLAHAAGDLLAPEVIRCRLRELTLPPIHQELQIRRAEVTSSAVGAGCLVWALSEPDQ